MTFLSNFSLVLTIQGFFDFSGIHIREPIGLAQRVTPAVTRLTVYRWLHIHTQSLGPRDLAGTFDGLFGFQSLNARDPQVRLS